MDRSRGIGLDHRLLYRDTDRGHHGAPGYNHHTSNRRHNNTACNSSPHNRVCPADFTPPYADVGAHPVSPAATRHDHSHTTSTPSTADCYSHSHTASAPSTTDSHGHSHAASTSCTAARPSSR